MRSGRALGFIAMLGLLAALPVLGEQGPDGNAGEATTADAETPEAEEEEAEDDDPIGKDEADEEHAGEDLELRWSLTPIAEYRWIEPGQDDDGVGGFLDQYEFVPNKSSAFPVELGVRDAALDLLGPGDTPRLQIRLESPTSNLGVSGSQIDEPFFNQRALALGRLPGLGFDLRYRRLRTEETRLFPNTAGVGLLFEDRSRPDDRFARERTGFSTELRARPHELYAPATRLGEIASPELSLRGGYEVREGDRQLRFLVEPANRWFGLAQRRDQQVGDVGGGLLLAPGGLLTMTLDFDHQRFREDAATIHQSSLGGGIPATQNTIGFIPDTDRTTGTARLRSRIGERAVLEAGFQASVLEQVEDFTPFQRSAGLRDNSVQHYSGNVAADVALVDSLSANAFLEYDRRENDIERSTSLFNPGGDNGSQVDEFIERWARIQAGLEAVYRINAANRLALGGRFESVERDLDFSSPGCPPTPCFPAILPVNALVNEDSESYTVYGRAQLRPLRRVGVRGEIGYRTAPETGYVTDLDDYVYGRLRASYTPPLPRSVVLSLFAKGGSGENRNQVMAGGGGLGTPPAGPNLRRRFDRHDWLVGLTASASPWERLSAFASFFVSNDVQDYDLALSTLQRYVQPATPVTFSGAGNTDYQSDMWSIVLGTHVDLDDRTDASLSYAFTRADTRYGAGSSPQLALVRSNAEIDSNLHAAEVEIGRWLREGLRVLAGYRFEYYDDGTRLSESLGSAVRPFDLSTTRHTVTLGVTLTSALLEPSGAPD